jgi:hypothetical protein
MILTNNQIKAQEQKILGDLGETIAVDLLQKFYNTKSVINLNDLQNNFPLFDLAVNENGKDLVFTVKARRKYTPSEGKLNGEYNLTTVKNSAKKLESFQKAKIKHNLQTTFDDMYWIAIPYEQDTWVPVYYGHIRDLPACNIDDFVSGKNTYMRIKMKESYTSQYQILGHVKINLAKQTYETKNV